VTQLKADLTYPEHPIKILDKKDRVMRYRTLCSSRYNGVTTKKKKLQGKVRTCSILTIQSSHYRREDTCDCSLFLLGPFSFTNLGTRFLLRGEDCDTPSVTIAATMFYSTSAVYLGLSSNLNSNPSLNII
jgi:hypothetical protein